MRLCSLRAVCVLVSIAATACHQGRTSIPSGGPPTLAGIATDGDGNPAAGALLTATNLETGVEAETIVADGQGRFVAVLSPGNYGMAATSASGYGWLESVRVPDTNLALGLTSTCEPLEGMVSNGSAGARIKLIRKSKFTGDTFVVPVRENGHFHACLPPAHYLASSTGDTLSMVGEIVHPGTGAVVLSGFDRRAVQTPPVAGGALDAHLEQLLVDIQRTRPGIIGLGEASHGTAEFVTARGQLTFELIRRMDVRLLMFEFDAMAGVALDDYVNGADIDAGKAVADLGFWTTNTVEFLAFLEQVRKYNTTAADKVHVWGVDVQNTQRPSAVLLAGASRWSVDAEEQEILRLAAGNRGKSALELRPEQRARLDSLLARISAPASAARDDLVGAVAARSLTTQLNYWAGDMRGELTMRRDRGMAELASFLSARYAGSPACLWAHDAHIARDAHAAQMGHYLAALPSWSRTPYYAVGFYLEVGTSRAWDFAGKVGVTSHPIPPAPEFGVEHVLMNASGRPAIAWIPLRDLPRELATWLQIPRMVRELSAVYINDADLNTLRSIRASFDAVVIVQHGHDTTPATGRSP